MTKKLWNAISSVKLTVVLFVLILVPATIGTIVQQNAPDPSRYVELYGPFWNGIFRALGFYDIYHDSRFIVLLVLLGLNTFACTIKRLKLRWNRAGTLMTHFGLLFILIGAVVGAALGVKGFMRIPEGGVTDKINVSRAGTETDTLPFSIRLTDFILDTHPEPSHDLIVLDVQTRKQQRHRIAEGKTVPISMPQWAGLSSMVGIDPQPSDTIRIQRIIPHAAVVTSVREGPDATGVSAIKFRMTDGENSEHGYAVSRNRQPYLSESTRSAVYFATLDDESLIDNEIARVANMSAAARHLEVTVQGTGSKMKASAEIGSKFKVDGTEYEIEVLRYVPDFVMTAQGEIASRSDHPHNPALQVRVTGPQGGSEKWIFARFPSAHGDENEPLGLALRVENHVHHEGDTVLVLNVPDEKQRLVLAHIREGQVLEEKDVEIGMISAIQGTNHNMVIDGVFENANIVYEVVDRPDMRNRPAVEILIEQGGSATPYFLWNETPADIPGYRLMYAQNERVRDYYSILQVIDKGEVVAEKQIEVNDPLRYKGYAFYQSSYDQENLSWSGLQVKKDPGVPFVYAGFLIQISGMIVIFYINPLLKKVRHARVSTLEKKPVPQNGLREAEGA